MSQQPQQPFSQPQQQPFRHPLSQPQQPFSPPQQPFSRPQQSFYPPLSQPQQPFSPPQQPFYPPSLQPQQTITPPPSRLQYPQPIYRGKQKLTAKGYFVVSSILSILGIFFMFSGHFLTSINSNSDTNSSLSISHGPSKVGDTITINSISCTLTSVDKLLDLVIIHIKFMNNSNNEIHYSAIDFHLQTEEGQIIDAQSADSNLVSGALAPKGIVDGDILFSAENVQKGFILWQPDSSQDLSNKWQFNIASVSQTPQSQ